MKKKWSHSLIFAVTVGLIVYICGIGLKNIFRYNSFHSEYESLKQTLLVETRTNQYYKRQLSQLNSPDFWELEAKTQLGYVKEGEVVYKIIPPDEKRK